MSMMVDAWIIIMAVNSINIFMVVFCWWRIGVFFHVQDKSTPVY